MISRIVRNVSSVHQSRFLDNSLLHNGYVLFDEIPKPHLVSLHRLMSNLIRENRSNEALDVFRKHVRMGSVDEVAIALVAKAFLGRKELGFQIHGFAFVSGFMNFVCVSNSLMRLYSISQDLTLAFRIFDSLDYPDTVSYNTMLSGFEESKDALFFTRQMHSDGIEFDARTFSVVLAKCADGMHFDFGWQLHCLVLKLGFHMEIFVGNAMLTLYLKCEEIAFAEQLFKEMHHKDAVSWNAILSGYAQLGTYGLKAISVFIDMVKGGMKPDRISFTSVISACSLEGNLDFGKQVHCMAMKLGYGTHVSVGNVLMSMYSKSDVDEDAVLIFKSIVDPNVVSWTTMLSIMEEDAIDMFKKMLRLEVSPNDVTFIVLIHAITKQDAILEGQMVHGFCIKSNFVSHVNVANCFITMYGEFHFMEDFLKVFEEIKYRDIISWNSVISAHSLNGMYTEALHMFFLASKEFTPNPHTFGSVLHAIASSESVSLKQGQSCHGYLRKLGLNFDPIVSGALLDMYSKCGSISDSLKIFNELTHRSQVAWTAMISAHSRHGDHDSVITYFTKMMNEGVRPDAITFLSVLASCAHNRIVDMGMEIFKSMMDNHFVEPSAEHYSCVVDMLGRDGRLKEAEQFLGSIPGGPGASVLQSLLGACKVYGEFEMASRISTDLIAMQPNESGSYILMSNLFAEKGKWEKVASMRRLMRQKQVTKEIGFSWADVGDSAHLHGFSSGDRSHPLSNEIYIMAELLGSEMKRKRKDNYSE